MTRHGRIVILLLIAFFLGCGLAQAHSIKDRVKTPLDKERPGIDDVAYFVESYVFSDLHSDGTHATQYRFGVKEFLGVDVRDGSVLVRFITLDKKGNKSFEESMLLRRGVDGVWQYQPEKGGPLLEVFTYIPKKTWIWKTYLQPAIFGFTAVCAGGLLVLWIMRNLRKRHAVSAANMP